MVFERCDDKTECKYVHLWIMFIRDGNIELDIKRGVNAGNMVNSALNAIM